MIYIYVSVTLIKRWCVRLQQHLKTHLLLKIKEEIDKKKKIHQYVAKESEQKS